MSATAAFQVVMLSPADEAQVTRVLAESFYDYPVMRFLLGSSVDYPTRLQRLVRMFVMARVLREDPILGVHNGADLCAVATMSDPHASEPHPAFAELREETWRVLGSDAEARYDRCIAAWQPLTVEQPQLHVNMIGVLPSMQRSGLARRLLDHAHELARVKPDCSGMSLTTENPANVPLYQHFGYDIVGHARITDDLETWGFFRPNEPGQ